MMSTSKKKNKVFRTVTTAVFLGWVPVLLFVLWKAPTIYDFSRLNIYGGAQTPKTDSIVVLTGGKGRIAKAIELYKEGKADLLYISGANEKSSASKIYGQELRDAETMGKVILERKSKDTLENATETLQFVESKNIKTVLLVTSNYHLKRSLYIFRRIFPKHIEIIGYPVESQRINEQNWWKSGTGVELTVGEYVKYLMARFSSYQVSADNVLKKGSN